MNNRVVVFSEPFGMGHERAAEALIKGIKILDPGARTFHTNSIKSSFPRITAHFTRLYLQLINHFPQVWHKFYENGRKTVGNGVSKTVVYRLLAKSIKRAISEFRPNAVVCTHPFPAAVVSRLKRDGLSVPLIGIITDYDVHAYWLDNSIDMYIVGNEALIHDFGSFNFTPSLVSGDGIPIDPAFGQATDKKVIRRRLRLARDLPVLLVAGGGWGLGNLDKIVSLLAAGPQKAQIVVITGTNTELKSNLQAKFGGRPEIRVLGLVGNMHEYMAAADVMVTKPGGLSTSEGMAAGLPMVLFDVLYGQEQWNAEFLTQNDAAIRCRSLEEIPQVVGRLMENKAEKARLSEKALRLGKPNSGLDAASRILQLAY